MSSARRHRAFVLAAVLAIVCALVPDPVTVARTPTAYVPLDDALFTPVGELVLPAADAPSADGPSAAPAMPVAPADPVVDGPFGVAGTAATDLLPAPPPRLAQPPVGQVSIVWHTTEVSWYGPGLYGQRTACGEAMTLQLVGVAHRTLPCGTLVTFRWNGHTVRAPVVDRGPYVAGRIWDLTPGLCALLDHCFTGPISWKVT